MNPTTASLGIVGTGFAATLGRVPRLIDRPDVRVVAACSRTSDAAERFARTFDIPHTFTRIEDLIASGLCDGILVCTPNFLHAEQSIEALRNGLSVFVEKPMAISPEQARKMPAEESASGRVARVGFDRRFWPASRALKRLIHRGDLGQLTSITLTQKTNHAAWAYQGTEPPESIQRLIGRQAGGKRSYRAVPEQSGGGVVVDIGSHLVDQVMWLTSHEVVSVLCEIPQGPWQVELAASLTMRLDNDVTARIELDGAWNAPPEGVCLVRGESARASVTGKHGLTIDDEEQNLTDDPDRCDDSVEEFVSAIHGHPDSSACGFSDAATVVDIVAACYRSAREHRWVDLD